MADSTMSTQDNTNSAGEAREEDLDASIEADISQEPLHNAESMQIDSSTVNDTLPASLPENPASAEPRIPAKKDASLREFLSKMDDYAPIVRSSSSQSLATTWE